MRVMREEGAASAGTGHVVKAALLTADDLARALSVHAGTVRRWANAGVVPSTRIGGVIRFDEEAVRAALKEGTLEPNPVRERNREIRERARRYAENTWCYEIPRVHGAVIIVCHPGQDTDILQDPERLRKEFGLVDPTLVKKLSESWAAPPGDDGLENELRRARHDLAQLEAEAARRAAVEGEVLAEARTKVDELETESASERPLRGARRQTG